MITVVQQISEIMRLRHGHPDWSHEQIATALPEAKLTFDAVALVLDEIGPRLGWLFR